MPEETNGNSKPNFYTLYQKVGNIEGKLDEALKRMANQEGRINCVEKTQDQMVGKISVFGIIFGLIGGAIIDFFLKSRGG